MLLKRLSRFIIFIFILITLDVVIGKTLKYYYFQESSGLHYRTTYSMDSTKAEVLIFGASRANHHYVPEIFEDSLKMTYYNTGRDGTGIFYQLAILKSILKRHNSKIIILDYYNVTNFIQSDYDRLTSLEPYYYKHPEVQKIVNQRGYTEKIKLLSKIYPFNSQLLTIMVGNMEFNKKRKSDNKGYVRLDKVWKEELDTLYDKGNFEIDPLKVYAFREFIEIAKKSKAKVFVVFSPIYIKNVYHEEILNGSKISKEEGVSFLNYSTDTTFLNNRLLFKDRSHLNNNGANIFSQKLVSQIKKTTYLK